MTSRYPMSLLADTCEVFADGDWVESKDQSQAGIRLIQTGNVGIGAFKGRNEKARYVSDDTFNRLRCTEIFEGDCLISRLPEPAGRSCIVPSTGERMITAVDCTIVRFRPRQVLPEFFNYYSQSLDYLQAVDSETTGTTRKRISRSKLGQVAIPVPPVPEQQRIVGILDDAFAAIATAHANTEQNLRNARELFETQLDLTFCRRDAGWTERRLGNLCRISSKLVDPRLDEYVDLTHVGSGNIESDTGKLSQLQTAGDEGLISGKFHFDETMVLYSKIRPYLRKVARPDFRGLCSADMYPLAPEPGEITRDYLYYMLLSRQFTEYAVQGSARAGMPKVNRDHLFEYRVWLPAVEQQARDAAVLDSLGDDTARLATVFQRKLEALDALKQSLLHQAFTGAL